jgi:predicted AAA+ superfamily ATPase
LRSTEGFAVGFIARARASDDGEPLAIQVAETITDAKTRQRGLRALEALMAERKLARAALVALDEEERIDPASGPVQVVPAWRRLLRQQ